MSEDGKNFLIAALDPFHDTQLQKLNGFPDVETAPSILRCIKQSVSISRPTSWADATWDCHIIAWPWLVEHLGLNYVVPGNVVTDGASTVPNTYGGLQAYAVAPGQSFDPYTTANLTNRVGSLTIDPTYTQGSGRIVGAGFEITNTTSDLNRQGLVTVYRMPQQKESEATFYLEGTNLAAASGSGYVSFNQVRPPPLNTADAMLICGSRQWKAAEGCYCVYPFIGNENPPRSQWLCQPMVTTDFADGTVSPGNPSCWVPNWQVSTTVPPTAQFFPIKTEFVHMPGAIFTGLSLDTTLTMNWNVYYESFPSPKEKDILVLATPSSAYDPVALEFLSRGLSSLPVGVPAADNPSGEFFSDMIRAIADYAPTVGEFFGPAGGLIGQGIGKLANAYSDTYMTPQTSQAKPVAKVRRRAPPPPPPRAPQRASQTQKQKNKNKNKGKARQQG